MAWRPLSWQRRSTSTRAGLLLHTVKTLEWLAPAILAVPWWRAL